MTVWWKTNKYDIKITAVEVIKDTPQRIRYVSEWMGHKREETAAKSSEYHNFYPTFEAAKTALIERSKIQRQSAADEEKEFSHAIALLLDMEEPVVTGGTQ